MGDIFERYRAYLSAEDYERLLETSQLEAPSAVRANLLKTHDSAKLLKRCSENYGWQTRALSYSEAAYQVLSSQTVPSQTREHRLGYFYIQDAASILPVSLFDPPAPGSLLLDMAASPGGKSTQMIDLAQDRNFLFANDSSASRLSALRTVLQTWGSNNHMIAKFAGEMMGDWFPNRFDRVLIDAPCSMESLRISASHPHRPISVDERARLALRQTSLLASAIRACKVGGEVVYSTCTMAPEEDEAVLDDILAQFHGIVAVDPEASQKMGLRGLASFEGQSYHPDVTHALRVWPFQLQTNGFFAVKLRKLADHPDDKKEHPARPFSATGLKELSNKERASLFSQIQDLYGFDLLREIEISKIVTFQRADQLFLIPLAYLQNFATLPYYALGMPLGRWMKERVDLSAEFVLRYGQVFSYNVWTLSEALSASWLKGNDIRGLNPMELRLGTIVALRDEEGRNLGAGKYSRDRIRNLLPNRHIDWN